MYVAIVIDDRVFGQLAMDFGQDVRLRTSQKQQKRAVTDTHHLRTRGIGWLDGKSTIAGYSDVRVF